MSFLKTNYPLKRQASQNANKQSVTREDFERALMQHVGGSFVYIKPRKFVVMSDEQEKEQQ
jgi:hypothetical protein